VPDRASRFSPHTCRSRSLETDGEGVVAEHVVYDLRKSVTARLRLDQMILTWASGRRIT
jgi:hypothetical protein